MQQVASHLVDAAEQRVLARISQATASCVTHATAFAKQTACYAAAFAAGYGLTCAIVAAPAVVGALVWRSAQFQSFCDRAIAAVASEPPSRRQQLLRHVVKDVPVPEVQGDPRHSHGQARASRSACAAAISAMITAVGLTEYSWEMSKNDQKAGKLGRRTYWWLRDAELESRCDAITGDSVVTMIDVDYYVDMAKHLADVIRPHLLYTIVPSRPGGFDHNTEYCFDKDGNYNAIVGGGARYKHELWDYSGDCFVAESFSWTGCSLAFYRVDRVQLSETRSVVTLTPTVHWTGLAAVVVSAFFRFRGSDKTPRLVRFNPVTDATVAGSSDKYVKIVSSAPGTSAVRYGITGRPFSVDLTHEQDAALRVIASRVKTNDVDGRPGTISSRIHAILVGQITSNLDIEDRNEASLLAQMLAGYYLSGDASRPLCVASTAQNLVEYSHVYKGIEQDYDFKSSVYPIACPFGPTPTAPTKGLANNVSGAINRIIVPAAKAATLRAPSKRTYWAIQAFADKVASTIGKNTLEPCSLQTVIDRQTRPAQRRLIDDFFEGVERTEEVKHFLKMEAAYGKFGDPRVISPIGQSKFTSACYMYALGDAIKHSEIGQCFASGNDPRCVAERIAAIGLRSKRNVISADAERLDGTVSIYSRLLERSIMSSLFMDQYAAEIDDVMCGQYGFVVRYGEKIEVNTDTTRASGSAETSVFNTLLTMFNAFHAYARMYNHDYDAAWSCVIRLGYFLGDDSFTGDMDPRHLVEAAAAMGQTYDCLVTEYGTGPQHTEFLSRHYPSAFDGSGDSCAVMPRALAKLTTANRSTIPITDAHKFVLKCRSVIVNDPNTPVLGDIARKAIELAPREMLVGDIPAEFAGWWSQSEFSYPNGDPSKYTSYVVDSMPHTDVIGLLGWVDDCKSLDELMNCPGFTDEPPRPSREHCVDTETGATTGTKPLARCVFEAASGVCSSDKCRYHHENPHGKEAWRAFKAERKRARTPTPSVVSGDSADDADQSWQTAKAKARKQRNSAGVRRKNVAPHKQ